MRERRKNLTFGSCRWQGQWAQVTDRFGDRPLYEIVERREAEAAQHVLDVVRSWSDVSVNEVARAQLENSSST